MAIGTISPVKTANFSPGNKKLRVCDVQLTGGANYTTGGETVTLAAVGLKRIDQVLNGGFARNAAGTTAVAVAVAYQTNGTVKLQVYASSGSEQSASADLSTYTVRLTFIGY